MYYFQGGSKFCKKKCSVLEEILGLLLGSLPDDQGGFTCMPRFYKVFEWVIHNHSNLCTEHTLWVLGTNLNC